MTELGGVCMGFALPRLILSKGGQQQHMRVFKEYKCSNYTRGKLATAKRFEC